MSVVAAVLSGFALAAGAPVIVRLAPRHAGWVVALLPLALTLYFASLAGTVAAGQPVTAAYAWAPGLGVALSFRVDGLGLLFALLISGVGTLVMLYAGAYLGTHPQLGRFFVFLLAFMASMLGVVLADNVVALFVFWELTSVTSFLLVGFEHERASARAAALQALLVTAGAGLALLAGLVMLAQAGGSWELSELLVRGEAIRTDPRYGAVLVLVLLGAFAKSAQVPFHFWLPGAMEAPTPVSAYLHSATMVKAGVYLLARLSPALGGTDAWLTVVAGVGAATALVGGYLALTQTDLKRILAYSTVGALGTLVLLLGVGTPDAVAAALVFLLAHALYKGALFMVAGALDHATGTRDASRLGGLARAMPLTAAAGTLAALSLAGLGPLLSFVGKEMLLEALLDAERWRAPLVLAGVLSGALFAAVAGIAVARPFYGAAVPTPQDPHEVSPGLWLGPAVLAALGLLLGLAPGPVAPLVSAAATAVVGAPQEVGLALWHGLNPALALSALSVGLGLGAFVLWERLRPAMARLAALVPGPERWYGAGLAGLDRLAVWLTGVLQNGYLRRYVMTVIGVAVLLVGFTLVTRAELRWPNAWPDVRLYELVLALLILAAARVAVGARSRLAAVTALGVSGYATALVYLLYGAPDLAMTQILVETLTVLLYVLVFHHLPRFADLTSRTARWRDALVALAAGGLMTTLVLAATAIPLDPTLSTFFAEQSYPAGHGRNVVNVILVDFRALDTLGEITVLSLAALGVYAMLRLRSAHEERR
jgi:multicomponent Na+:H+ antiporter subunit A